MEHKSRLARMRAQKDYENWIEQDEFDVEGDRMLQAIKNFKYEKFFETEFYKWGEVLDYDFTECPILST